VSKQRLTLLFERRVAASLKGDMVERARQTKATIDVGVVLLGDARHSARLHKGDELIPASVHNKVADLSAYMKAIHGGQAKNDKIDSHKIAVLLRGGMLPQAYVYPAEMRATRDLLRRRTHLMRKRAELFAHVQNTHSQYNLPEIGKKIASKANREGVAERFADPTVQKNLAVDLALSTYDDQLLQDLEISILKTAKQHDANTLRIYSASRPPRVVIDRPCVPLGRALRGRLAGRTAGVRPFLPGCSRAAAA
jgi:Transposase